MKLTHYLNNIDVRTKASFKSGASFMVSTAFLACASLAMLTACSDEIASTTPVYTVGEADNAIVLSAGISEGGSGMQTRSTRAGVHTRAYNPEASHSSHVKFKQGTALTLRVDGVWKEKGNNSSEYKLPHGNVIDTKASQTTTATIGEGVIVNSEGTATHNKVTFTPAQQLYWDDYGSADPANMSLAKGGTVSDGTDGRARGLDILAVAVDNVTTAPEVSSWKALPWSLDVNQTSGWNTKDLLTSNNVKKTDDDNTTNPYKFDDRALGKLLEFTHAMSKVTVELTAGAGFVDSKFVNKPEVTLRQFYYTGTYNVDSKTPNVTDSKTDISAHLAQVKETSETSEWSDAPATWAPSHETKYDALVFPGNQFTATIADDANKTPTSETDILKINADGNIYTVTAAQLVKAMNQGGTTGDVNGTLEQGKNYILKITVNKTSIDVTATIKDWVDVESVKETPIIGFSKCYGQTGSLSDFAKGFTFYRSTALTGSYISGITEGNIATVNYGDSKYTMSPQLYWPDHSTHYFFRGIWPEVNDVAGQTPTAKVESNGILVENCVYTENTYPTDLMIGMPRNTYGTPDETCKAGHTTGGNATPGICATDAVSATHPNEGLIHMNFQYAMSQVIVKLSTNENSGAKDDVTFNQYTKVEIVDCYTDGKILLSNGNSDFTDKVVTKFTMNNDNNIPNKKANEFANYRNVIIPQNLTNGTGAEAKDLKFRITVGDGTQNDVYETVLGIKNIKVQEGSGEPQSISAWEPGKRYIYNLYITKTNISVTATLKNWIDVTASEDVWF